MKKICYSILMFLICTKLSVANIDLSSGKWGTSFDCAEWDQLSILSCDGLSSGGNWSFYTKDMSSTGWIRSIIPTEWYYNSEISTASFKSITVNGALLKTGTLGSLTEGISTES